MWDEKRARADEGFAMVVSIVVATVGILLVTSILAMGVHLNSSTIRERRWEQALQVAEAGIERTFARVNALAEANPDTPLGSLVDSADQLSPAAVDAGEFAANATPTANGFQIDAVGYVPSSTAANAIKRRIRVSFSPEPSFKYALFSGKSLEVKNDNTGFITGDVFANEDITVKQNATVKGNVISSQGWVWMENNTEVLLGDDGTGGSVFAGGVRDDAPGDNDNSGEWALRLDGDAFVKRDVHLQVEDTPCGASDAQTRDLYFQTNNGEVEGTVFLPGKITGAAGTATADVSCEQRYSRIELPEYTFQAAAYPGLVEYEWDELDGGDTRNLSGYVHVKNSDGDAGAELDLACHTIDDSNGDVAIISDVKVIRSNGCGARPLYVGDDDITIQLIVLDDGDETDPSIWVGNDLELPTPSPALLLYSKGYCDLGNTVINNGAVYCNGVEVATNMQLSYDSRIERLVGFGGVLYARDSFRELTASTAITTTT